MITIEEFYNLRLDKVILTKKDLLKSHQDWSTLDNLDQTKKYAKLVEKIKANLPVHLSQKILNNESKIY